MTRRRDTGNAADPAEAEAVRYALDASRAGTRRRAPRAAQRSASTLLQIQPPVQPPEPKPKPDRGQDEVLRFYRDLMAVYDVPEADPESAWPRNRAAHRPWTSGPCSCRETECWPQFDRPAETAAPTHANRFHNSGVPLISYAHAAANTRDAEAARLPDPAASRAVLIGVGSSPGLADLPEAEASVRQIYDLLRPAADGGAVLTGTHATHAQVRRHLARAADEASDTLILYYTGHGLDEPGTGRTHLATTDATMPIAELRDLTVRTRARHTLVLLDACTTTRSSTVSWQPDGDRALYMITATDGQPALARNPLRATGTTAFTGAVITALARGVAGAGPLLDIGTLYTAVDRILERDTLPAPRIRAWGHDGERWAIARNPHPHAAEPLRDATRYRLPRDLLTRAAGGEHQAWDALVEKYGKLVRSTLRAFRLTPDQTADATRATWLYLLEHLDTVTMDSLPGLLTATARDTALAVLRNQGTNPYKTCDTEPPQPRPAARRPRRPAAAASTPPAPELRPAARRLVEQLRALQDDHGLSLGQLSATTGYSRASWARWFDGRSLITPDALTIVAARSGNDPAHLHALLRDAAREAGHDEPAATRVPASAPGPAGRRALTEEPPGAATRLLALGRDRAVLVRGGRETELNRRHSDILVLLARHPDGLTDDQLATALYGVDAAPALVVMAARMREDVLKLRLALEGLVNAGPNRLNRLTEPVTADFLDLAQALDAHNLEAALAAYTGPLLPGSDAPAVRAERDRINSLLLTAVHDTGDTTLLDQWTDHHGPRARERPDQLYRPGKARRTPAATEPQPRADSNNDTGTAEPGTRAAQRTADQPQAQDRGRALANPTTSTSWHKSFGTSKPAGNCVDLTPPTSIDIVHDVELEAATRAAADTTDAADAPLPGSP